MPCQRETGGDSASPRELWWCRVGMDLMILSWQQIPELGVV